MAAGLLLTLTLQDTAEGSVEDKQAVDGFVAALVADLNGIEPGSAATLSAEEADPGSKGLGALLLGALTAEVHGERVALNVVRFLCSRLVEQPHPVRLKLSRKGRDGEEVVVELEGSPRNQETMKALLFDAEDVVRRLG
ncbi:MAG: hypothetical protein ACK6BG_14110 [Cyanobacteriota bacterium]